MKIRDPKLIAYFGTDELTREVVEQAYKNHDKLFVLITGDNFNSTEFRDETLEEFQTRIMEIHEIQLAFPDIIKELSLWDVDQEKLNFIENNLNMEQIERLSFFGDLKNIDFSILEKCENLRTLSFEKANNDILQGLKLPPKTEKLYFDISDSMDKTEFTEYSQLKNVVISDASKLGFDGLDELEKKNKNAKIIVYRKIQKKGNENNSSYSADVYSIEEYRQILTELHDIVHEIKEDDSDEKKVEKIFKNIAKKIRYDKKAAKDNTDYAEEEVYSSRSMKNGLIRGKAVCVGYAEIMRNACALMGIDAVVVGDDKHAWIKAKIDGEWYNFDPTSELYYFSGFLRDKDIFKNEEKIEGPPATSIHPKNHMVNKRMLLFLKKIKSFVEQRRQSMRNRENSLQVVKTNPFSRAMRKISQKLYSLAESLMSKELRGEESIQTSTGIEQTKGETNKEKPSWYLDPQVVEKINNNPPESGENPPPSRAKKPREPFGD